MNKGQIHGELGVFSRYYLKFDQIRQREKCLNAKREKSKIKSKINLIYNSKLQSNDM